MAKRDFIEMAFDKNQNEMLKQVTWLPGVGHSKKRIRHKPRGRTYLMESAVERMVMAWVG